ncbi:MAG: alpha-glucan family phosphorylase [Fimbriimonadales bacterium]|nr:alpha-glucan family phosphorylase [Fimbriimonadales bacterium]
MWNRIPTSPQPMLASLQDRTPMARVLANYAWTWLPQCRRAVQAIDPLSIQAGASPIRLLANPGVQARVCADSELVSLAREADEALGRYLEDVPEPPAGCRPDRPVAYFCAEYGLHESFPQYCGGLGILAGDHLREASDMGLPLIGVGLFYRLGFFRQELEPDGRQQHVYERFDPLDHPLERVLDPRTGVPLTVSVRFPDREVAAAVWRVAVGRTPLLLLDTDLPQNRPGDRAITAQLYMLGRRMRFYQECVLGIGGLRALEALGIEPSVLHMNEGHSALLLIERLAQRIRRGERPSEAMEGVRTEAVLTIHTPVPAGNERFDAKLAAELLGPTLEEAGVDPRAILRLGRDAANDRRVFDMTAFALRLSKAANGVSLLHGKTADATWRPVTGKPVGAVTNGVHPPTWLGPEMRALYEEHGYPVGSPLRPTLRERTGKRPSWEGLSCSDAELWAAHAAQKRRLVEFANERLLRQHVKHGWSPEELEQVGGLLDPEAFLVGFARRFTPYKRPSLLWLDPRRLRRLLEREDVSVQILFAGKAHPADGEGQAMVAEIVRLSRERRWRGRIVFLEEYDMAVARHLVQGVDLWINNPIRPLEASGTSGMKAALNGVPNCSVLDGWWDEGFEGDNGWAVGDREAPARPRRRDRMHAEALYEALERAAAMFGERGPLGIPDAWIRIMRRAIATSAWAFSTRRMLEDYVGTMYR